jgi:hypothetical protein
VSAFMQSDDTALLLIDHQSGLFETVKDIDVRQLRTNVAALAKMANLLSLPVITCSPRRALREPERPRRRSSRRQRSRTRCEIRCAQGRGERLGHPRIPRGRSGDGQT